MNKPQVEVTSYDGFLSGKIDFIDCEVVKEACAAYAENNDYKSAGNIFYAVIVSSALLFAPVAVPPTTDHPQTTGFYGSLAISQNRASTGNMSSKNRDFISTIELSENYASNSAIQTSLGINPPSEGIYIHEGIEANKEGGVYVTSISKLNNKTVYGSLATVGGIASLISVISIFLTPIIDENITLILLPMSLIFLMMITIDYLVRGRNCGDGC